MKKRQTYEQKIQAQLDAWGVDIDRLKRQADHVAGDLRVKYAPQIAELRSLQKTANKRLAALRASGDDAWQDVAKGLDEAWRALGKAVEAAWSRFQPPKPPKKRKVAASPKPKARKPSLKKKRSG